MSLTEQQTGVVKGAVAALLITITTLACAVMQFGPRFSVAPLAGRYALCAVCLMAPALTLAFCIARLAQHRFFSTEDIAGSALTRGSGTAILLQSLLQNTLEQAVLALFADACWCIMAPPYLLAAAPAAALLFLLGRVLFFAGYAGGAPSRALGFALTFYPTLALLVGSVYLAAERVTALVHTA